MDDKKKLNFNELNEESVRESTSEKSKKNQNAYYNSEFKFRKAKRSVIWDSFSKGLGTFLVIAAAILFYFALLRLPNISTVVTEVIDVLKPVIYGLVFAYLLDPIVCTVERYLFPLLHKHLRNPDKAKKYSRTVGIVIALIVLVALITTLCNMLLPDLFVSVRSLIFTLPVQMNHMLDQINNTYNNTTTTGAMMQELLSQATNYLQSWMRNDLLKSVNQWMALLTEGMIGILGEALKAIIGLIISIYILFSKETFIRQIKKMMYALMTPYHTNVVLHIANKTNDIFGGFIIGKLIDSAIIGVLCFIGLTVIKLPYALLISVIVGVTNVIPFFGPYIGAVPSAFLLLVNKPIDAVYFCIFILILQQVDGNIIGPKLIGSSTGLSPFWVIVAILVGGGLFGFVGMIIGVPTFGVAYYLVETFLDSRLRNKKLPEDSENYDVMSYVDNDGKYHQS